MNEESFNPKEDQIKIDKAIFELQSVLPKLKSNKKYIEIMNPDGTMVTMSNEYTCFKCGNVFPMKEVIRFMRAPHVWSYICVGCKKEEEND